VIDRFDVIVVRIVHESPEVAGVIFRPKPRLMERFGTLSQGRLVERAHGVFVGGLEGDVGSRSGPSPVPSAIQNVGSPSRPYPMASPKSSCRE
jgi:hypothetical protein